MSSVALLTDGLTRIFRLAVDRRTHAPHGIFAANDLDSQLIMRVIPALRRTERSCAWCERSRRVGVGEEGLRMAVKRWVH